MSDIWSGRQYALYDVLARMVPRLLTKLGTACLRMTYPFAAFGRDVSIHFSCEISRAGSQYVAVGNSVYIASDVWLNVVYDSRQKSRRIVLGDGCKIGRRSVVSAKNLVELGSDVLLAPSVLIMDHNHEYRDPEAAISAQGVTEGGQVTIGPNCWLGYGSVVVCSRGHLSLGRNSVVAANSVVTQSFPSFSVVAGNPATLVRRYDPDSRTWIRVDGGTSSDHSPR